MTISDEAVRAGGLAMVPRTISEAEADVIGMPSAWWARAVATMERMTAAPPAPVGAQQADDYLAALDALWQQQNGETALYKLFASFVDRVATRSQP